MRDSLLVPCSANLLLAEALQNYRQKTEDLSRPWVWGRQTSLVPENLNLFSLLFATLLVKMICSCSPSWTRVVWSWWPQQPRGHQGHVHESCPNDGRDRVLVSCGAEFSSVAQMRISPRLYRAGLIPALFWSQPTCERSRVSVRSCDQVCLTLTSPDHQPVVLLLLHLACYYH